MKTSVEIIYDDNRDKDYKAGEKGYIDGYTVAADGRPYAVVVIGERFVLCSCNHLKATGFIDNEPIISGESVLDECDCIKMRKYCIPTDCPNTIILP